MTCENEFSNNMDDGYALAGGITHNQHVKIAPSNGSNTFRITVAWP